jgi:hypothetical protein
VAGLGFGEVRHLGVGHAGRHRVLIAKQRAGRPRLPCPGTMRCGVSDLAWRLRQ